MRLQHFEFVSANKTGSKIQRTYYSIAGQAVGVRVKKVRTNGSTESDDLYYMYTDHLGNVGALSDKNGNYVSGSLTLFRPFGDFRRTPSTNPDITDRGYTGHAHNNSGDNDLGLIYMRARFYLPEAARFISADTLVPDPMNPQQFNRYTYSLNSPLNFIDPSGHLAVCFNNSGDRCNDWMYDAIALLEATGGSEGKRLAQVFWEWEQAEDKLITITADLDNANWMYTRQWDPAFVDIHIGKDVITRMKQGEIAVLGHELEHVSQGILQAWSIQGEVMAYQVEYSIRDAMGIGQSRNTQASMEEAPSVQPKRVYDPYSLSDLLHARNEGFLNTKTYNRPWEPTLPWHIEILTEALQVIPSWVKWNQIQASRPY